MDRKYAIYRQDHSFICDVKASNELEALAKAKLEDPDAHVVVLVCHGNDLGVNGVN